jgi:hypothetical protein
MPLQLFNTSTYAIIINTKQHTYSVLHYLAYIHLYTQAWTCERKNKLNRSVVDSYQRNSCDSTRFRTSPAQKSPRTKPRTLATAAAEGGARGAASAGARGWRRPCWARHDCGWRLPSGWTHRLEAPSPSLWMHRL